MKTKFEIKFTPLFLRRDYAEVMGLKARTHLLEKISRNVLLRNKKNKSFNVRVFSWQLK